MKKLHRVLNCEKYVMQFAERSILHNAVALQIFPPKVNIESDARARAQMALFYHQGHLIQQTFFDTLQKPKETTQLECKISSTFNIFE